MPEALISSDSKVMMGKPTVAGTRITVESILEKLAAGELRNKLCLSIPVLHLKEFGAHRKSELGRRQRNATDEEQLLRLIMKG